MVEAQRGEQSKETGENKAEAALGRGLEDFLPSLELMRAEILVFHLASPVVTRLHHFARIATASRSLKARPQGGSSVAGREQPNRTVVVKNSANGKSAIDMIIQPLRYSVIAPSVV